MGVIIHYVFMHQKLFTKNGFFFNVKAVQDNNQPNSKIGCAY